MHLTEEKHRQRGFLPAREPKAELLSELEFGRDETATKRGAPRRAETRGVEEEKDTFLFAEKDFNRLSWPAGIFRGHMEGVDDLRLVNVINKRACVCSPYFLIIPHRWF